MSLAPITTPSIPARSGSRRLAWAGAVAACCVASVAAAQPLYKVTPLGVLPGHALCTPANVNELGEVVGACMPAVEDYFAQRAFVWRQGAMKPLGLMAKGSYSMATGINASGVVTGDGDTGSFRPQGWVKTGAKPKALAASNSGNSHTRFIADAGWIGGYHVKGFTGGPWTGAVWTPDPNKPGKYRMTDLPQPVLGTGTALTESFPYAFNQAGQAVGYASNEQVGQRAVFWNSDANHTVVSLAVYPGDSASLALGLNDLGQAVGYSAGGDGSHALLWTNDTNRTAMSLPLPAGDNSGWASAINNQGQILGWSNVMTNGLPTTAPRAIVWRDGGVHALQSLLDPATGTDWQITDTTAINQRGQIVGVASRGGVRQGVLLTPSY